MPDVLLLTGGDSTPGQFFYSIIYHIINYHLIVITNYTITIITVIMML